MLRYFSKKIQCTCW